MGAGDMGEWRLRPRDLKNYPHFDPLISASAAEKFAADPKKVAAHTFYPFMRYVVRWTRYADRGEKGDVKERPIRYAARRDAYVFAYYRHLLSQKYEEALAAAGLSGSVLAYRRILGKPGESGKCNINFAHDAFLGIQALGNCCAIALDISAFFESLDHQRLKDMWCRLLGVKKLPPDHFRVFEAITRYSVVDKQAVYERLGHFGPKRKTKSGKPISGYLKPYKDIPKQLCTGKEFQEKIAGTPKNKSIIETNFKPYGVPQGAPISDLLANLYLLDFDIAVSKLVTELGGTYYRYSDDILLLIPGDAAAGINLEEKVRNLMPTFGAKLLIKEKKSSVVAYEKSGGKWTYKLVKGEQGKNGLEYLGFRFDGNNIYIRNSTIQNLYRKVTRTARREASAMARRYPNKTAPQLRSLFSYEAFMKQFGRVEGFYEMQDDYRTWTFWTYANRAATTLGPIGAPIRRQLRRHREIMKSKLDDEFDRAVARRDRKTP